eukprot:JP436479.1.p1 GENE.JP436479.1~~JP436479.1.p1  ORF type:complete len:244 (-),score=71.03 JP436479.1:59-790(-)
MSEPPKIDPVDPVAVTRAACAEFIGVFLFCFMGCGCAISASGGIVPVAFAFGLAIGVFVFATRTISGGHLNPAVTFGFVVTAQIAPLRGLVYIIAQLAGAIFGCLFLKALTPITMHPQGVHGILGACKLAQGVNPFMGFLIEMVTTFMLMFVVFATAVDPKGAGNKAPLAIGLTVVLGIIATGRITGAALNPARAFGPAVAGGDWDNHWVYWIGPLVGSFLAAIIYKFTFLARHGKKPKPAEN